MACGIKESIKEYQEISFPTYWISVLSNKARSDPELHHRPVVMENITTVFMMIYILSFSNSLDSPAVPQTALMLR